jgi:cytochrome P450
MTTVSTTLSFAMVFLLNYPEVQTKMQQELDAVVGRDRLPTLDDRARSVETSVPIKNIVRNRAVPTYITKLQVIL